MRPFGRQTQEEKERAEGERAEGERLAEAQRSFEEMRDRLDAEIEAIKQDQRRQQRESDEAFYDPFDTTDATPGDATPGGGTPGGGTGAATTTTDDDTDDTGEDETPPILLNVENATLIKVNAAAGPRYYVEYTTFGTVLRHEVGDQEAFDDLSHIEWEATLTMSENAFAGREGMDVGLIDERFGIDESYTATITRDLRVFAKEDLPAWQRNSPEVMTILMNAANEGFSEGCTLGLVAETDAFNVQFPQFAQVRGIHTPGASLTEAFDFYVEARDQIRDSIRAFRGIEADVSDVAIGGIMALGWDPPEIEEVLRGEAVFRQMPGATDQINNILKFQGSDQTITDENFLDFILEGETDRTPMDLQEMINDAIRAQSFAAQGIDLSPALAEALGTGEAFETIDANAFGQIAQETAENIFRFRLELDAEREGITRDDLIRAAVNGTASAKVNQTLAKFARRRNIEKTGFATSAQQTGQGRLRILPTSGL